MYERRKYDNDFFGFAFMRIVLVMLLAIFINLSTNAQGLPNKYNNDTLPLFTVLPIEVTVNPDFKFELDVLITDEEVLYLNIEDLFHNLGIACTLTQVRKSLEGFISVESNTYAVDLESRQLRTNRETISLKNSLLFAEGGYFLESTIFPAYFGINLIYNPRSLTGKLAVVFELPILRQAKLEKQRQKIASVSTQSVKIDSIVPRTYHAFRFGTLDWTVSSHQAQNEKTSNYLGLALGAELLGGQTILSWNISDRYKFDQRQLYYSWRWVDNDFNLMRQAQLGLVYGQGIAFLHSPVIGGAISNSPTSVRKASGHYIINDVTEPNWTVELYINDVLMDYTTADASGLYVFKVPIVYGYTVIKLKFYGPLGEERSEERIMNVPFTFTPAGKFEYSLTGGLMQYDLSTHYGHGVFNYGLSSFLTLGVGWEYLSSIGSNPNIPYLRTSLQPYSKMTVNLEYAHGVRWMGNMNYQFSRNTYLELYYAKYYEEQRATEFNALEERKVKLIIPAKIKNINFLAKINFNQFLYRPFTYNQFDVTFSTYYRRFSLNSSFFQNWVNNNDPYMYSNFSLSYRLRNGLVIRPTMEVFPKDLKVTRIKLDVERRIKKLYFIASLERNFNSQNTNVYAGVKYELPFARTQLTSYYANKKFGASESAQGSLAFGADNHRVKTGINSALGKGGILFYPFLDLNQNGRQDNGEPKVLLSSVKVAGGKAIISEKDSIVRISDLNAFVEYTVEFTDYDLPSITWRFKNKTFNVLVDPHQYKRINLPILSVGEVTGMVYLKEKDEMKGQGRITVQFFDLSGNLVAGTLTESDGFYSYLGLKPGVYMLAIDKEQMVNLDFTVSPQYIFTTIEILPEGASVTNLNFILKSNKISSETKIIPPEDLNENVTQTTDIRRDSIGLISNVPGLIYTVQIGVFKKQLNLERFQGLTMIHYEILPNLSYRFVSGIFDTIDNANEALRKIRQMGRKDAFVSAYLNGKRISLEEAKKLQPTKN